jgi:multisubunit Na+/H+ antiporter MnhB subunit
MHTGSPIPSYVITIMVVALVFGLRIMRMRQGGGSRRLRLELMWILPAIISAAAVAMLVGFPPHGVEWAWLTLALAAGGGLGWVRGSLIPITVDPETHLLNTRTSPAALAFLLVLFLIRFAARYFLAQASALHIATALLTDGFVLFGAGLYVVSRLEMWLRARRLLAGLGPMRITAPTSPA